MMAQSRRAVLGAGLATLLATVAARPQFALAASEDDGLEVMRNDGRFNRWVYLIQESGLAPYAAGRRPYTTFAPIDAAMAKFPNILDQVLGQNRSPSMQVPFPDMGRLVAVIRRQVIAGLHPMSELAGKKTEFTSLAGTKISVDFTGSNRVVITDFQSTGTATANVVGEPLEASNSIIYALDNVDLRSF